MPSHQPPHRVLAPLLLLAPLALQPAPALGGPPRPRMIVVAGGAHACAIVDAGHVKCWGSNSRGQLGLGDENKRSGSRAKRGVPLQAVDLGKGAAATAIAAGTGLFAHSCAVLSTGQLKCWGNNEDGQLGLGDTRHRGDQPGQMGDLLPVLKLGSGRTVRGLATGNDHTCALLDTGDVKCWGRNNKGQLGVGDTRSRGGKPDEMGDKLPRVDLGAGRTVRSLSAGMGFTCALLDNAQVKCWGKNDLGQLGLGDKANRGGQPGQMGDALPTVDLGVGRSALAITAGGAFTCALLDNEQLKCWGEDHFGQLGDEIR